MRRNVPRHRFLFHIRLKCWKLHPILHMKHTLLAGSFLLFGWAAHAQAGKPLTAEDLYTKFGYVSDPQVSPDGKTVVFGINRYDLAENKGNVDLYSMPTAGGPMKRLTDTKGSEGNQRWRPDGKKIGFLATADGASQLFEMNPDGTDRKQVSKLPEGMDGFGYAPSGNRIFCFYEVKLDKTEQENNPDMPKNTARVYDGLMFRHWTQWSDQSYNHAFIIGYADGALSGTPKDIMTGERFDAPILPFGGTESFAFSPDGNTLAYSCKKQNGTGDALSTNTDIYLYDLATGRTTNVSEANKGYDNTPLFSPDGSRLMWLSMQTPGYESDVNRVVVMDLKTKNQFIASDGFDITASSAAWGMDGKRIYIEMPFMGTVQVGELVLPAKGNGKTTFTNLTYSPDAQFDYTGVTPFMENGKPAVLGTRMSMHSPIELYVVNAAAKNNQRQLSHVNDEALAGFRFGRQEKRMVKASDGKEILTWVIYPPDFDASKKYPALLYCQGGPQSQVSNFWSTRWNFQLMANHGYIVVAPNRRGLPGFGKQWNDEIQGNWGLQPMQDLLSSIDDVSKEKFVDKDRLGAVGASFGGYAVYWLAGNHKNRFHAFIAHCGVFNLESMYGATEETFFNNHDFNGPYWQTPKPATYDRDSPHKYVQNWNTPILVIHNERDFRVPIDQGMQAFTAAQVKGIPSRLLSFPDEGHWVLKPQNAVVWNREFYKWLDTYLKR